MRRTRRDRRQAKSYVESSSDEGEPRVKIPFSPEPAGDKEYTPQQATGTVESSSSSSSEDEGNQATAKTKAADSSGSDYEVNVRRQRRTKTIASSVEEAPKIHRKETTLDLSAGESSSESDIESYLRRPSEISLSSSFFEPGGSKDTFSQIERSILSGVNRLSDSGSDSDPEEKQTTEEKEWQAAPSTSTSSRVNFQQLNEYAKKIEEAKLHVEKYVARKSGVEGKDDISTLLTMGEKTNTRDKEDSKYKSSTSSTDFQSSDSENNWEEVAEGQQPAKPDLIPKEGVEITLRMPDVIRKKKGIDLVAAMKRRLNKIRKENQVYVHRVHLLCWLAHGNYVNGALNKENVLAMALSLLPSQQSYPSDRTDFKYLEQILSWYRKAVIVVDKAIPKNTPLDDSLATQIEKRHAFSNKMFVYIFICILRSLGIQCRLVLSLQLEPLRPPANELCSLAAKEDKKAGKGGKKKSRPNEDSEKAGRKDVKSKLNDKKRETKKVKRKVGDAQAGSVNEKGTDKKMRGNVKGKDKDGKNLEGYVEPKKMEGDVKGKSKGEKKMEGLDKTMKMMEGLDKTMKMKGKDLMQGLDENGLGRQNVIENNDKKLVAVRKGKKQATLQDKVTNRDGVILDENEEEQIVHINKQEKKVSVRKKTTVSRNKMVVSIEETTNKNPGKVSSRRINEECANEVSPLVEKKARKSSRTTIKDASKSREDCVLEEKDRRSSRSTIKDKTIMKSDIGGNKTVKIHKNSLPVDHDLDKDKVDECETAKIDNSSSKKQSIEEDNLKTFDVSSSLLDNASFTENINATTVNSANLETSENAKILNKPQSPLLIDENLVQESVKQGSKRSLESTETKSTSRRSQRTQSKIDNGDINVEVIVKKMPQRASRSVNTLKRPIEKKLDDYIATLETLEKGKGLKTSHDKVDSQVSSPSHLIIPGIKEDLVDDEFMEKDTWRRMKSLSPCVHNKTDDDADMQLRSKSTESLGSSRTVKQRKPSPKDDVQMQVKRKKIHVYKMPIKKKTKVSETAVGDILQVDGVFDSSSDDSLDCSATISQLDGIDDDVAASSSNKPTLKNLNNESPKCALKRHPKRLRIEPIYKDIDSEEEFKTRSPFTSRNCESPHFSQTPTEISSEEQLRSNKSMQSSYEKKVQLKKLKVASHAPVKKNSNTSSDNLEKSDDLNNASKCTDRQLNLKKLKAPCESMPKKKTSPPESSKFFKPLDVRNDVVSLIKGRMNEQRHAERAKLANKSIVVGDESDSDYAPSPVRRRSSEGKMVTKVKVKRRVLPRKEIDRKVFSSDEDGGNKKKQDGNIWVEVFLEAEEKWISVDVVKGQVHCVKELFSRATHPISYIFSWDNNNRVKDITKRYCTNWNTVTRKLRVEQKWLDDSLRPYLGKKTARDKEEDEDLARQQLEQPLPAAISEYKDHPLYVLKRHLLKFQAIYPPDAITLGFIRKEAVYSRDCVYTLHSRDIWLKHAKTVKLGETPYKIVKARPKYDKLSNTMITDQPLEIFGEWQVEDYVPPTAENGVVPRNAWGNVELFKACMLPKKTVHLQLPGLNKVARKLNVDCAPAVVGFDFHSGGSHPTFDGFVVCEEHVDSLVAAWYQEQEEIEKRQQEKYEKRVYGNWRKLIKGLLIRERLKLRYNFGGETSKEEPKEKPKPKGPRFIVRKKKS